MSSKPSVSAFYIDLIHSFGEQCKDLISAFKKKHSENFSDFAELFKHFKFGLIYEKHIDSFFYYDFKEDSLQIAKDIMLHDHFLGGLYLLYGLYYVQDEPKHSIRLTYREFKDMMEFIKEERHSLLGTCQPGFVFSKLMRCDAFAFSYFGRDFSMEENRRTRLIHSNSYLPKECSMDKQEWLKKFLEHSNIVDDLNRVDGEYFKKKLKLKEEHGDLNLALDMLPEDTIGDLLKSLLDGENRESKPSPDVGMARRNIKCRALKRKLNSQSTPSSSINNGIPETKKKGCPRGQRKSYFNLMVNRTKLLPSTSESSSDSDEDNPKLDMPEVD